MFLGKRVESIEFLGMSFMLKPLVSVDNEARMSMQITKKTTTP